MTATQDIREGGCLCGAVRFRGVLVQHDFNACSCDMCRRWGGGPFMAAQMEGVAFTGAVSTFRASAWAERGFCAACGGHLYYRADSAAAGTYEILAGALDDQSGLQVAGEIFADRNPGYYALPEHLPRQTEAECLARWGMTPEAGA